MLPMEIPAISFFAVRLVNFPLRSAIDPSSLRSGCSLPSQSSLRVDAEELRERRPHSLEWLLVVIFLPSHWSTMSTFLWQSHSLVPCSSAILGPRALKG